MNDKGIGNSDGKSNRKQKNIMENLFYRRILSMHLATIFS